MFLKGPILISFILSFCLSIGAEEPWGKDAPLAYSPPRKSHTLSKISTPLFGQFGEIMIHFHQSVISPADGPRSNYFPSSSQYTLDAMRRYGFFKGFSMGCDRLMRENSEEWVYRTINLTPKLKIKFDPVP